MTLKQEKNKAKAWGEELVAVHGLASIREALDGYTINTLPGVSLTCYDRTKKSPRFTKGSVPSGQSLMVTDVRSGARHSLIFVCEIHPKEFANVTFSGKGIDSAVLGIEITAYDAPAVIARFERVQKEIAEAMASRMDPRFTTPAPTAPIEDASVEGFGSW